MARTDDKPPIMSYGVQGDPNPGPESAKAIETIMQAAYDDMAAEEEATKPTPIGYVIAFVVFVIILTFILRAVT